LKDELLNDALMHTLLKCVLKELSRSMDNIFDNTNKSYL